MGDERLIPYSSIEEFQDALTKGTGNGGVDAIFNEIPYLKLYLAKYCNMYTVVGPTYKTDGFGFCWDHTKSTCKLLMKNLQSLI
ncbi:hypothetical protein CDL15_Pgr023722 [Punica granatum]|uniref:Ionotropic glutamate receptor C-terminal domain-containing protein n=1 Tax=Punica granatum TaxID=22663 RepID=A0A218WSK1_PUNGR|nr:hypothetical protein CDL15_Pgr023722 [Punica granatum]PKI63610.1 hypothetical protein CRG98_015993 [Punica granatum]